MLRNPFSGDPQTQSGNRNIPILPSTTKPVEPHHGEPMDLTPSPGSMRPPLQSSPEGDSTLGANSGSHLDIGPSPNGSAPNGVSAAAATSSQQPKVVQTAFIHKLYNMLEDPNIQHLISWSSNNENFVMSPSADFSKVLAQYFKHTNISSFVRQLNMYGFHKVSDVFHTGSPESTLWEFKHGNGNFKRGDLAGLREIKRRASRHALIHRDSFSAPHKPSISQPATPAEPMPADVGEVRLANLEHSLYDVHARLMRTEESNTALSAKCQALNDNLIKCLQWSHEMSQFISTMIPDPDNHVRRDLSTMQKDIGRQLDMVRSHDDPHESLLSGRQPHFSHMALEAPLSPRQVSEERRPSIPTIPPRANFFRPPLPSHFNSSPRRYGSIGTANPAPNYHRPVAPLAHPPIPSQHSQHPLSNVSSPPPGPNLGRRHTSADIRVPGWPGHGVPGAAGGSGGSPFASGQSSAHWPSSPNHTPSAADQQVRDTLAQYEFGAPRPRMNSQQTTPPLTSDTTPSTLSVESNWSLGGPKFPSRHLESAPATRRSSMASNVHSLLNPAETAERDEEDPIGDDRKRKRMQ